MTSPTIAAFTPADTAIVLVDHQPGVLGMVGSLPHQTVAMNAGLLARLGEEMGLATVVTSTREAMPFLGTNIPEIQSGAPRAYAARVARAGTLNAFHDPAFVAALAATGKRNLVMAGLLTDVCLFHSVASAIEAGYQVQVVADASGTSTTLAEGLTYDRLRDRGAVITSTYGILFELYSDLSKPDGLKAEGIVSQVLQEAMKQAA